MKPAALFLVLTAVPLALAQTPPAKPHTATAPHRATAPCVKLPELSPKIPALPAGVPCAKALYTVSTMPFLKVDYVSPMEGTAYREALNLDKVTFSLDYVETKVGTGALVTPTKWLKVHYTGYLLDGSKFDSSVDRGEPIAIQYGKHQVIPGWDTGFDGMHVGGKRRLIIPYQLAYGANGRPPTIPARATLVFDVELVGQSDTDPTPPPAPPKPPTPPATAVPPTAAPAAPPSTTH